MGMRPFLKQILQTLPLGAVAMAAPAGETEVRTIHGQASAVVASAQVELAVTLLGGHMAPVTFFRDSAGPVRPYHVTPWQDEPATEMPAAVLTPLRGDFFCLPFGGNAEEGGGEKHPPHGEIAGAPWTLLGSNKQGRVSTLRLTCETKVRKGRVTKELSLVEGENVIYSRHRIEGFAGRAPLGHHATLAMPEKEGSVRISSSAMRFGMTCPGLFSDPAKGEYQALQPGQRWDKLSEVPMAWKDVPAADLTRLPARRGFADLVQIVNEPWEKTGGPAWVTATMAESGYLWFALKNPAVLNSTVLWLENHGRYGHPWKGRNNCLGIEDVTAYFAEGLAASTADNLLTQQGVATSLVLRAEEATVVDYIQGVVKVPPGFATVQTLEFKPASVTFIAPDGQRVSAAVQHEFLKTGQLR